MQLQRYEQNAVQTTLQFSTNPGIEHWEAVKCIFCYLKGMEELWLSYRGQQRELLGYANADGSMGELFPGMHS